MLDINYINELLQEGKSVKDIRTILQIGEKSFQKQIRELNYKYNQKIRRYEPIGEVLDNPMTNFHLIITNLLKTKIEPIF